MQRRDVLLALILVVAGIIFIGVPLLFIIMSALPQPPCIGLVKVSGVLTTESVDGWGSAGIMGSDDFAELIKEAQDRNEIKAVVFEINSPGGSVVASGEMYRAVKELDKPKVMFFREVAASGGYYLAMGGDTIISDPNAITGSIGAITTTMDLSALFEDLGINFTNIKSGEFKDMGDINRPLTEEERQILQDIVDDVFTEFRQIVIDSRSGRPNFKVSKFDEVADGRIMTGRQALKLGMVDELGDKQDALDRAAEMAGIEGDYEICELSHKAGFLEMLFSKSANALSQILAQAFDMASPNSRVKVELR